MIPFALAHFFPGLGFWVLGVGWSMSTSVQLATYGRLQTGKKSFWTPLPFLRGPCAESYLKLGYNFVIFCFQLFVESTMYNSSIKGFDEEHIRNHNITFWFRTGFYDVEYDLWELIYRNRPHLVMYYGFMLSAFVEIIQHFGEPMPKHTDKAMMMMAFIIEACVFSNHAHGREHLDAQLHVFLAYAVYGCVITCALEFWNETSPIIHYGKSLFVFLQASWFAQMILMLYWPVDWLGAWTIFKWDIKDPRQIPNLTFYFGIHIAFVTTCLLVQYLVVRRCYAYKGWQLVSPDGSSESQTPSDRKFCCRLTSDPREYEHDLDCLHAEDDSEFLLRNSNA